MSTLVVEQLTREFVFDCMTLPDPNPLYSVQEVINFHSGRYPNIISCIPKISTDLKRKVTVVNLESKFGTKG